MREPNKLHRRRERDFEVPRVPDRDVSGEEFVLGVRVLRDLRELTDGEPTGGLERGDFEALGVADSGD